MEGRKYKDILIVKKFQPNRRAGSVDSSHPCQDKTGHQTTGIHSSSRYNSSSVSALNSIGTQAGKTTSPSNYNKENIPIASRNKIKLSEENVLKNVDVNHNNLLQQQKCSSNSKKIELRKNNLSEKKSRTLKTANDIRDLRRGSLQVNDRFSSSYQNQYSSNPIKSLVSIGNKNLSTSNRQIDKLNSVSRVPLFQSRAGSQPPVAVVGCGVENFKEKLDKFNNLSTEDLTSKKQNYSQLASPSTKKTLCTSDIYCNNIHRRKYSIPNSISITSGGYQCEGRVTWRDNLPPYVRNVKPNNSRNTNQRDSSLSKEPPIKTQKCHQEQSDHLGDFQSQENRSSTSIERKSSDLLKLVPSSSLYNRRTSLKKDRKKNSSFDINKNITNQDITTKHFQHNLIDAANAIPLINQKSDAQDQFKCPNLFSVGKNPQNHSTFVSNSKIRPYTANSDLHIGDISHLQLLNVISPNNFGKENSAVNLHNVSKIFNPLENSKIRPYTKSPTTEVSRPFPTAAVHTSVEPTISSSPLFNLTATIGNHKSLSSRLRERQYDYSGEMADSAPSSDITVKDLVKILSSIKPKVKPLPGYEQEKLPRYIVGVCMDECYPGLYIGDLGAAMNIDYLKRVGITHVLNTSEGNLHYTVDTNEDYYREAGIKYMGLQLYDVPTANITQYFIQAAEFIDGCLLSEGKILIHCFMGMSRSSTIASSYLMQKRGMNVKDALKTLRQNRSIYPNEGFLNQLIQLQLRIDKGFA